MTARLSVDAKGVELLKLLLREAQAALGSSQHGVCLAVTYAADAACSGSTFAPVFHASSMSAQCCIIFMRSAR